MSNERSTQQGRRRERVETTVEITVAKIRDTPREKIELVEIQVPGCESRWELRSFTQKEKAQAIKLDHNGLAIMLSALLDVVNVDWVSVKASIQIAKRKERDSATGTAG